jgi:hypothetical protein
MGQDGVPVSLGLFIAAAIIGVAIVAGMVILAALLM